MNFNATQVKYEMEDAGGYSFTITSTFDEGRGGWSAVVVMTSSPSYTSPLAAAKALGHVAKAFIRDIEQVP